MKVDFHILNEESKQKALIFVCQLIEKAYVDQKQSYIHTGSLTEAEYLDRLLWTYRDDSFIPHHLVQTEEELVAPVQIGYDKLPKKLPHLLINLTQEVPIFYKQFSQIIEIVYAEPTIQQLGRERYRQYRDQGCEITTHKL